MTAALAILATLAGCSADAGRLGDDDFATREWAERRLRAAGVLAVPALRAAGVSESAEVRFRAGCRLGPWRELAAEQYAESVLHSPWPVDPRRFYEDRPLRERVRRLATRAGLGEWVQDGEGGWVRPCTADLVPDDVFNPWNWGYHKPLVAAGALAECKRALGVERAGWPFR